jgi:hypothetical protein
VIDNFFPDHVVAKLLEEFPAPDAPLAWRKYKIEPKPGQIAQANKLGFSDLTKLGPNIRQMFWEMNSARFLGAMEKLSGVENLIGDPQLDGGGIHQSLSGAVLAVHSDFSHHPIFKLDRRLNILLYLNPTWNDEWEGHLELWDRKMTYCVKRVAPLMNRVVIFSTTQDSFHGHPQPLNLPEGITRKSMALYYYTNGRPEGENDGEHGTLWQERPGLDALPEPEVAPAAETSPVAEPSPSLKSKLGNIAKRVFG